MLLVVPVLAFAAIGDVPEGDGFANLLALILNFKTMATLAIGSAAIVVVMQLMKKFFDFKYQRLVNIVLGLANAVILSIAAGVTLPEALAAAMFTSGGASILYNELKAQFFDK